MQSDTNAPDQIFGYDVIDTAGNKIGSVDNVWVDDASNELEFIGVKTGWLMGKSHIVPVANAQFSGNSITVPFEQSLVKDAPSYPADHELTPTEENEIYSYYGDQRSVEQSPTGLAAGGENLGEAPVYDYTGTDTGIDQQSLTLSEEDLEVGTQQVEAGRVRLRKVVRTEHEEVPVELQREQVSVERIDAGATDVPTNAFEEQEIEVPVMREEPVVSKEAHASGGVRLNKNVTTETRTVGGDTRTEDVEVVDDGVDAGTTTGRDAGY